MYALAHLHTVLSKRVKFYRGGVSEKKVLQYYKASKPLKINRFKVVFKYYASTTQVLQSRQKDLVTKVLFILRWNKDANTRATHRLCDSTLNGQAAPIPSQSDLPVLFQPTLQC